MVRGLRAVTPAGVLDLGRAPESAAGPDLRQLLIGSEGVFGVITRVRRAGAPSRRRRPATRRGRSPTSPPARTALRAVAQTGTGPTVLRLSDEAETGVNLATTENIGEDSITGGCLAITVFEGTEDHVESRHAETRGADEGQGRHVAGRGAGARMGARPLQRAVPARLAAVGGRAVRDAWRRRPTGPTSPR